MNYHQALKILGLSDPPSPQEVKKSFRRLALRSHPDRNPNNPAAAELFRECAQAYNYLIRNFDSWAVKAAPPDKPLSKQATVEDLEDIFDDIFGFTKEDRILGLQNPQEITLSLIDLAYGIRKQARLEAYSKCKVCRGSGAQKNRPTTICTYCFGSGQIKVSIQQEDQFKICPRCSGRGRKVQHPCLQCNGFGRIRRFQKQEVEIPQGLLPGQAYTLHSFDLKSKKKCDLFIRPRLKPHPLFAVEKSDILCEYPITHLVAKKGGMVDIPTLWGWTQMTVPAGSQSGRWVFLKGWGLYTSPAKKSRGVLRVKLHLLSEKKAQKEAALFLQKVAEGNKAYGKETRSWWKKILGIR